jgi:hypothetical protein
MTGKKYSYFSNILVVQVVFFDSCNFKKEDGRLSLLLLITRKNLATSRINKQICQFTFVFVTNGCNVAGNQLQNCD